MQGNIASGIWQMWMITKKDIYLEMIIKKSSTL